jgi:hypothetical protein
MSRTSADKLRRRPCGGQFRRAWQIAVDYSTYRIEEGAHDRARRGVARPIFYKGEQVGEYRHYDERLTMFLLRSYRPERYGKPLELPPALLSPDEEERERIDRADPGTALDGGLTWIELDAKDVPLDDDDDDEQGPYAL